VWVFRTPVPQNVSLPALTSALSGNNDVFASDLNGDGHPDLLPGLGAGQFGRKVKSFADLNRVITRFNDTYAGTLTPHGQALVNAGLFTEAQMKRLGAVISPIPLVPLTNPEPWHNRFTTDIILQRPITFRERIHAGPFLQVANLFNHAPAGLYGPSLSATFGSLNYDYAKAPAGLQAADLNRSIRGRNAATRAVLLGVRVDF
jgi:hypothetical protein